MTDYLVYNDQTGEFVAADEILAVQEAGTGASILLRGSGDVLVSPLRPRELLRRLTIMRFKRENGETKAHTHHGVVASTL